MNEKTYLRGGNVEAPDEMGKKGVAPSEKNGVHLGSGLSFVTLEYRSPRGAFTLSDWDRGPGHGDQIPSYMIYQISL